MKQTLAGYSRAYWADTFMMPRAGASRHTVVIWAVSRRFRAYRATLPYREQAHLSGVTVYYWESWEHMMCSVQVGLSGGHRKSPGNGFRAIDIRVLSD
jgi:hypothetical protein